MVLLVILLHLDVLGFREIRAIRVLKLFIRLVQIILLVALHGAIRSVPLHCFVALRMGQAGRWRDSLSALIILIIEDLPFTTCTLT